MIIFHVHWLAIFGRVLRRVCVSHKKCLLVSSCLCTCISKAPTGWIYLKSYIEGTYENLSRITIFCYNGAKMLGALHEDKSTLWHCCISIAMMVMQHATMLHYTYKAYLVKQKRSISQAIRQIKNLDHKFQEKNSLFTYKAQIQNT